MLRNFAVEWVEWIDAEHDGGWTDLEEEQAHKLGICESLGWVVHEDQHRIILSTSLAFEDDGSLKSIGNKQYIPRGMITKRKVLAPVSNRRAKDAKRQPKKSGSGDDSGTPVSS